MPSCIDNVCTNLLKHCSYYKKMGEWCDCALKNYTERCETEGLEFYTMFVPISLLFCVLAVILVVLMACCRIKKDPPPPMYENPPMYKEDDCERNETTII